MIRSPRGTGVKRSTEERFVKRTAEEAAETRKAILAAARALFAERGYAAVSTTEVVDQAGVSRGALYHHFGDKADLFRAVFSDLETELNETVTAQALASEDPAAAFVAGCRAWMDFAARDDYRRIAVIDAPAVLGHEEWHAVDASIGLASMVGGLRALHRAGVLAERPDRALATVLFGALTEAGLAAARGDGEPDELFGAFLELVRRLARPRSRAALA
jgi:AcrR family transcriptional regulator